MAWAAATRTAAMGVALAASATAAGEGGGSDLRDGSGGGADGRGAVGAPAFAGWARRGGGGRAARDGASASDAKRRADAARARRTRLDGERLIPQPGPPKKKRSEGRTQNVTDEGVGRATIATLNAPGIHVVRCDKRGREFDDGWGDGWDLVSKPSAKLRMVRDMISQRGISMMAVTETRLRGEEMQAVRGHMRRAGLDHTGTPGRVDENSGHAVWGVSLILRVWDTRRVRAMGVWR